MKGYLAAALAVALFGSGCSQRALQARNFARLSQALEQAMEGVIAEQLAATRIVRSTPDECLITQRAAAHLFSEPRYANGRVRDSYDHGGFSLTDDPDKTGAEIAAFFPDMPDADRRRFARVMVRSEHTVYGLDCDWTVVHPGWRSTGDLADLEAMLGAPDVKAALAAPRNRWDPCRVAEGRVQDCDPYVLVSLYRPVRPAGSDEALIWAHVAMHPDGVAYQRLCHLRTSGADWRVVRCAKHSNSAA